MKYFCILMLSTFLLSSCDTTETTPDNETVSTVKFTVINKSEKNAPDETLWTRTFDVSSSTLGEQVLVAHSTQYVLATIFVNGKVVAQLDAMGIPSAPVTLVLDTR